MYRVEGLADHGAVVEGFLGQRKADFIQLLGLTVLHHRTEGSESDRPDLRR